MADPADAGAAALKAEVDAATAGLAAAKAKLAELQEAMKAGLREGTRTSSRRRAPRSTSTRWRPPRLTSTSPRASCATLRRSSTSTRTSTRPPPVLPPLPPIDDELDDWTPPRDRGRPAPDRYRPLRRRPLTRSAEELHRPHQLDRPHGRGRSHRAGAEGRARQTHGGCCATQHVPRGRQAGADRRRGHRGHRDRRGGGPHRWQLRLVRRRRRRWRRRVRRAVPGRAGRRGCLAPATSARARRSPARSATSRPATASAS